jgi:Lhr-like helicase
MISKGLKAGDIFTDHGRKYKVLSVNSDGTYVSSYIGEEEKVTKYIETSEQNVESEESADQNEESLEKKYTKTQIRRMKKEELDLLCTEYGIDVEETDAKREALIEKLGV